MHTLARKHYVSVCTFLHLQLCDVQARSAAAGEHFVSQFCLFTVGRLPLKFPALQKCGTHKLFTDTKANKRRNLNHLLQLLLHIYADWEEEPLLKETGQPIGIHYIVTGASNHLIVLPNAMVFNLVFKTYH